MALYLGSQQVAITSAVESGGNYQEKTNISPTTSSQTITPDSGYDALSSVQINAMPTMTLPSSVSSSSSGTKKADITAASSNTYLNIPTGYNSTAQYYLIKAVSGGATNIVQGTFTTSSTTGSVQNVTLSYSGSGYPILAAVWVSPDMFNNSTWYGTIQRYAVGAWMMLKAYANDAPTYSTSGNANAAMVYSRYKSSTSSASSLTITTGTTVNTFSSTNAAANGTTCARFTSKTNLSIYVASTSYGFMANTAHKYIVVYSS